MKRKRNAVSTCEDCERCFESHESSLRHFNSRSHTQNILEQKNASLMGRPEIHREDFEAGSQENNEDIGGYHTDSSDEGPTIDDMEDLFLDGRQGQVDDMDANADESFSSEKFFLLYCYAHGVMRPKVKGNLMLEILTYSIDNFPTA